MEKFNIRDHVEADAFFFLEDVEDHAEDHRMDTLDGVFGPKYRDQYRDFLLAHGVNLDHQHVKLGRLVQSSQAECRLAGCCLDLVDCSSAGPDSGNMDHKCNHCGRYYSCSLY